MSNKQSSVEWLYDQMSNLAAGYATELNQQEILEKAKEMHKEEIKQAIMFGDCRGQISTYATSEQYYKETYGGDK